MKSIRLDLAISNSIMLKADKDIVVRVLINLLTNAVKYSKVGGAINVSADVIGDNLQVAVRDDGKGISQEKLPHVFDRFWQGDPEQVGKAASTGLGLTFCKLAMEQHGGSISAHSAVNEGTTIRLTFPASTFSLTGETNGMSVKPGEEVQLILDHEHSMLKEIAKELEEVEVFQVGKLTALFKQFGLSKIKSRWATDLVAAVHQGDETKYNELLSAIIKK